MSHVWEKPVIIFYKDRTQDPETKAFTVVKARKLTVTKTEEKENKYTGTIKDFFPIMGNIDYMTSKEGKNDHYVLCWFEDKEEDFTKFWRQLTGVTFQNGISFTTDKRGKRTYNAECKAKHAKLE
ncbi:MAG TPA: hypothetical protein VMS95_00340 [Candidatus Krumholzibacteriaceae bacterium]|nr:hypothetical protein [Candidatus Krumholzibacteriaceae bacterium]